MHHFYLAGLLGFSAVPGSVALSFPSLQPRDVQSCCNEFKQRFPNNTFFTDDVTYTSIDEDFFSASSWLGPACIVSPVTAEDMSSAIKTLADSKTPFAIRGGGHMPIPDAANIDSRGVLLASSGFDQLKLSEDKSTIEVGAGNKWGQVYEYLAPYKLTVVGGRAGLVGVPGFLLGGGISFFGNEYGWASANVVQYDCVLANGDIVSATPENSFSDLFWALRGGGNSFAILTAVHLKTISLPAVAVGETTYNGSVADDLLDSIYDFAIYGSKDVKAGIEPRVQWIPQLGSPTYHGILFYNGDDASPPALVNFTDKDSLQPVNSTFRVRDSMYNWTQEADSDRDLLHGLRARFNLVTIRANRQALEIIHDTFLKMMTDELEGVASIVGSLAFVPITAEYLKVSTINGGDPMAVDASQAPYILVEQTFLWSNSADDDKISDFLNAFNANVTTQLNSLNGVQSSFLYLNYANENQAVFEGYPEENVARMKDIRDKYDPDMVFTDLMVGGWKVGEV